MFQCHNLEHEDNGMMTGKGGINFNLYEELAQSGMLCPNVV